MMLLFGGCGKSVVPDPESVSRISGEEDADASSSYVSSSAVSSASSDSVSDDEVDSFGTDSDPPSVTASDDADSDSEISDKASGPANPTSEKPKDPTSEKPKKKTGEYRDGDYLYRIDISSYLQYICPKDKEKYLLIANRANPLEGGKNWKPNRYFGEETVKIEDSSTLTKTAAMAMKAMLAEAEKLGVYDSYINNGYRSYDLQTYLYENYIAKEKGRHPDYTEDQIIALVDTYSARPGTSEHQTGLAVDFSPVSENFAKKAFYKYLMENAYKFGFILRYEQSTIDITGYKAEPWHWRFVGREAATYIFTHHITLEEYMDETHPGMYKPMSDFYITSEDASSASVSDVSSEVISEEVSSEVISEEISENVSSEVFSEDVTSDLLSEDVFENASSEALPDTE